MIGAEISAGAAVLSLAVIALAFLVLALAGLRTGRPLPQPPSESQARLMNELGRLVDEDPARFEVTWPDRTPRPIECMGGCGQIFEALEDFTSHHCHTHSPE